MMISKTVTEFLKARQLWREQVTKFASPDDILCDPGDEIICDLCNGDAIWKDQAGIVPDFVMIEEDSCICRDCAKK